MIELVFAIVIVAIGVVSLPMMTQVTTDSTADTLQIEEAIFEAYVKALEITDSPYDELNATQASGSVADIASGSKESGLKYGYTATVTINPVGSRGFGGLSQNDGNISEVSVTLKDESGNPMVVLYAYDFNVSR